MSGHTVAEVGLFVVGLGETMSVEKLVFSLFDRGLFKMVSEARSRPVSMRLAFD